MASVRTELYRFRLGDVEDPEIYCAGPIWDWQQTDHGKWCMTHATDIAYHIDTTLDFYGYRVRLIGNLTEPNVTFMRLKWGQYGRDD